MSGSLCRSCRAAAAARPPHAPGLWTDRRNQTIDPGLEIAACQVARQARLSGPLDGLDGHGRLGGAGCKLGGEGHQPLAGASDSQEAKLAIHAASSSDHRVRPIEKPRLGHTPDPRPAASAGVFPFKADLDLTELDTRSRPGATWPGKGIDICRSSMWFRSRKLCYPDRELLVAVHLVDDQPTPLCGVVAKCDYDGEGLYVTQLKLQALPRSDVVKQWLLSLHARGGL